jgi:hypothetical protein
MTDLIELPGAAHPLAKLCDDDVRRMRLMREAGATFQVLADTFGISRPITRRVISGERWRHVS